VTSEGGTLYEEQSYAVLEISREFVDEPNREVDHKVAKLVAELNGKGHSKKAALDFLRDTLGVYTSYKKISRVQQLQSEAELSPDEQALLDDLLKDDDVAEVLGSAR
jgi:hypothetical protein